MPHKRYKFPVAPHSYFRVLNFKSARRTFLGDMKGSEPVFRYKKTFMTDVIARRIRLVTPVSPEYIPALTLVLLGARLQETDAPTAEDLDAFRAQNELLFGAPRRDYADYLLSRMKRKTTAETQHYWDYIEKTLRLEDVLPEVPIGPSPTTFRRYKAYLSTLCPWLFAADSMDMPPLELMQQALDQSGLAADGWRVLVRPQATSARVVHKDKVVIVSEAFLDRRPMPARRIVIHEVYGHAMHAQTKHVRESEGMAVLLEQLLSPRFTPRRTHRYFAASMAYGIYGSPMTFRQTFELVWRSMILVSKFDISTARERAFDECVRVFRGGRPDIAGSVYLKDLSYMAGNLDVWDALAVQKVDYTGFTDILDGKRNLLS